MPVQALFKDLGKRFNDLINKEFPTKDVKVELKASTPSGVEYETSVTAAEDKPYLGVFKPTYKWKDLGLELTGEVNTNRDLKAEVSSANQLVQGLKLILTAQSNKEGAFATFADEYKHELASVTGSVDYGKEDGSTANTSFVVGVDKYALGAALVYHLNQGLKSFEGKLAYASPDFDVTLYSKSRYAKENETTFGVNYFQKLNEDLSIGSDVTFDSEFKPKLTFGSQYKLHTDSVLKGNFDTTGRLNVSYGLQFNKVTKATFAARVDTTNLSKNNSSAGFLLTFTP